MLILFFYLYLYTNKICICIIIFLKIYDQTLKVLSHPPLNKYEPFKSNFTQLTASSCADSGIN